MSAAAISNVNLTVRVGEMDKFQFAESYFDLPITLAGDKHGDVVIDPAGVNLEVSLKFEDGCSPTDAQSLLMIDPRTPTVMNSHQTMLRVMVNTLSMNCDNKSFVLHVTANSPAYRYISPAMSAPFKCVKYVLKVVTKLAEVWYKDEGGRDKCMDMMIQLVNSAGHLVTDRRVPLRLVLKYESGLDVSQQELFKISPESRRFIDDSGSATIKFRIDDVSKNHQKQAFAVQAAPDIVAAPLNADIGCAISSAVDIKSKRNKRKLEENNDDSSSRNNQPSVRMRTNVDVDSLDISNQGFNNPANNIYTWIQQVLNMLDAVSWKRVGFERRFDGSEDRTKPLHAMTNPNPTIDQIKAHFHEMQVENSLLMLSRMYDDAVLSKSTSQSSNGASVPTPPAIAGRGLSAVLGQDQLAGVKGVGSPAPLQPPILTRHGSSREGSANSVNLSVSDLPPLPERQPSMWRQQSLEYFGSCVESMMGFMLDQQEIDVSSILAVDYQSKKSLKNIGMPAFNSKDELVGFYKYVDGGRVLYLSVEDESIDLGTEDVVELQEEAQKNSELQPLLVRISKTDDYIKDLDRLKENALKELWMSTADTS